MDHHDLKYGSAGAFFTMPPTLEFSMQLFDLSHTITTGMPVYPGTPPPRIQQTSVVDADGFAEKRICLHTHVGTHIDAPAHVFSDGAGLDTMSIDRFIGTGRCLTVTTPLIDEQALAPVAGIVARQEVDFLLFVTGWSRYWGSRRYFSGYPVLSEETARFLQDCNLKGVGFDCLSADRQGSVGLPIHKILLQRMIIVENLCSLERLPPEGFLFSCLPLKLDDADGAPVRAAALCS